MKADLRISVKDYSRNKNLKVSPVTENIFWREARQFLHEVHGRSLAEFHFAASFHSLRAKQFCGIIPS